MSLRIQNNVEAFNAHRQLTGTAAQAARSMEKLSSGYRINRAADDAAGLAISEKMRSQIGGLAQAQRNAQDGVSLVQTGEGALNEVHSILQRVRDLAVQYNNGTLATEDKAAIQKEATQLQSEVTKIGSDTKFNGIALLTGTAVTFHVGANAGETVSTTAVTLSTDVASATFTLGDGAGGGTADIDAIDTAIKNVSTARANFGAVQNRLESRLNTLSAYQENLVSSESRIRDVDMADEMTRFTKLQILQQAGTSMLAQANQAPQNVLTLLR